jgi:hypothetical protein
METLLFIFFFAAQALPDADLVEIPIQDLDMDTFFLSNNSTKAVLFDSEIRQTKASNIVFFKNFRSYFAFPNMLNSADAAHYCQMNEFFKNFENSKIGNIKKKLGKVSKAS